MFWYKNNYPTPFFQAGWARNWGDQCEKSAGGPQTAVMSRDAGSESTYFTSQYSLAHFNLRSTEILGESPHQTASQRLPSLRITWSFIMLNLLSILSAFAQVWLCHIRRFFRFGFDRRYAAINAADSTAVSSVGYIQFVGVITKIML